MRVLVAGATGVMGAQLLPLLAAAGHEVVGLSRSGAPRPEAKIVAADALDRTRIDQVVQDAKPDAVINMLTAIPAEINPKRLAQDFDLTNRLRTDGTRNLLDAAEKAGVQQVISQGLAYAYEPDGTGLATEDAPLWKQPPRPFVPVLAALRELERRTMDAGGLVVRFGHLYGPGTIYAHNGSFVRQVRAGKLPLVGGGTATFSFTHVQDGAAAVVAALARGGQRPENGRALNVVDDHPAPMSEWLPHLARLLDAPEPKRIPTILARLAVGPWGIAFMTQLRGADNTRAKRSLDWAPRYPSWRTGFAAELGG
jgi:nucleoside-diphosphate-sugar epimerase